MKLSKQDAKQLDNLVEIIRQFRDHDPKMPIHQVEMLLLIARDAAKNKEGSPLDQFVEQLGMSYPTVSRNVSALSDRHRYKGVGLKLIEARETAQNLRHKSLSLTTKGQRLIRKVLDTIIK